MVAMKYEELCRSERRWKRREEYTAGKRGGRLSFDHLSMRKL